MVKHPPATTMTPDQLRQELVRGTTEGQLLASVKDAAETLGYIVLHSSDSRKQVRRKGQLITVGDASDKGRLDLELVPPVGSGKRTLYRELKGYSARKRLGQLTPEQTEILERKLAAGEDAGLWAPEDWHSGLIHRELLQQ